MRLLDLLRGRRRRGLDRGSREFQWDIFLSHAGEDHEEAEALARWLKEEFRRRGRELSIFNTSEVDNRFIAGMPRADLFGFGKPLPGPKGPALWRYSGDHDEDLKRYLTYAMTQSRAYLLLISPRSLGKNSQWIAFEIMVANHLAFEGRRFFFFPCLSRPLTPDEWQKLPKDAHRFMHSDISSKKDLVGLVKVLRKEAFKLRP